MISRRLLRCLLFGWGALFFSFALWAKTEVRFLFAYDPNHPEDPTTRAVLRLAEKNPDFEPVKWGGLALPGAGGRATFMLALAGGTAPDVYKAWFHILRHDVSQGFVYPLDEWIDPEKAARESRDLWDRVRVFDGHVWALPTPGVAYYGLVYRKDLVAAAGLDPESPPRTWADFRTWCVALTRPGRRAFAIENRPWGFLPWVQAAGGDVIRETSPGAYEAAFDSPAAVRAAEYLQSLVRLGVVRGLPTLTVADDVGRLFASGEIVAVFGGEDLVRRLTETLSLPSETIGLMPFPAADEGGARVLQAHRHFYALTDSAGRRSKEARDWAFRALQAITSRELADEEIRRNVAEGRTAWCCPEDLIRLGFRDELSQVPQGVRTMYEELSRGEIKAVTEPWVGFWQAASDLVQREFLGLLLSDKGGELDCRAALAQVTIDANRGLMFENDRTSVEQARPFARIILGALIIW